MLKENDEGLLTALEIASALSDSSKSDQADDDGEDFS